MPAGAHTLAAVAPFNAAALLAFLAARAVPGVEEVTEGRYSRTLALARGPATIAVTAAAAGVRCELELAYPADARDAIARCAHLFDVGLSPASVAETLARDPLLAPLARRHPGLRVPGAADGFELAVRAVVGQQVSVAAARTLLGRIVAIHGERLRAATGALTHLFPSPAALAEADPATLPVPRSRAETLRRLGALAAAGELELGPDADPDDARARLATIPGVGPWTVGYIAMRALGDPDVFLRGDAGVRRALARLPGEADPKRCRPWRSYAVMHLWKSLTG